MKLSIVLVLCLIALSNSQPCLDPNGNPVNWWVKLLFPGTVPGGFAYLDSSYAAPSFVIFQEDPDSLNTPLTRTLQQINDMNLQTAAWND